VFVTQAETTKPAPPRAILSPYAEDPEVVRHLESLKAHKPKANPLQHLPDVDPRRIPSHVAIIMDGNGRWAEQRGFPRIFGHRNGAAAVRRTVEQAGRLGIDVLTLYSFSLENWKRPKEEVDALMMLCLAYLEGERDALIREGIRFKVIGRREGLPPPVVEAIEEVTQATRDGRTATLCLAINYGSRAELTDAARSLARDAKSGRIDPDAIDEPLLSSRLATDGLPDPDLLIRTAGEMRVSNFLLWQISYAELHVTNVLWPDFQESHLNDAVRDFAGRRRRFGGLDSAPDGS
jgi:undecaprenyl diphosphate synthase